MKTKDKGDVIATEQRRLIVFRFTFGGDLGIKLLQQITHRCLI